MTRLPAQPSAPRAVSRRLGAGAAAAARPRQRRHTARGRRGGDARLRVGGRQLEARGPCSSPWGSSRQGPVSPELSTARRGPRWCRRWPAVAGGGRHWTIPLACWLTARRSRPSGMPRSCAVPAPTEHPLYITLLHCEICPGCAVVAAQRSRKCNPRQEMARRAETAP